MAYHYTESGLRNVWLQNGYTIRKTPYGETVSIVAVDALHRALGTAIAKKAHLTGSELRFLRKEMDFSQRMLADLIGTSEQSVSLWERRGKIPKTSERLICVLYLERATRRNVKLVKLLDELANIDRSTQERIEMVSDDGHWQEAA